MTAPAGATAAPVPVEVWKAPTCGCCKDWISHLEANGFKVKVHDTGNTAARAAPGHARCSSARATRRWSSGYVIEGHVPAREIQRLLTERPSAVGLAVPGMPVGSPGMDGPAYGSRKDPYDVLLVRKDGSTTSYQSYQ